MSDLEREKFEAQVRRQIGDRGRKTAFRQYNGKYEAAWLQSRWEGWLARSESAPSNLRRAWEQGRGNTKSVVFEYGSYFLSHYAHGVVLDEIDKLEYPGESTPTTPKVMPKMLDRARQWLEKHVATVESDQVAHFMAGFANDVAGEPGESAPATQGLNAKYSQEEIAALMAGVAGSPAPGWQIYKSLAEKVEDGEVSIDSLCDGSYSGSPAPAPTEEK